MTAGSNGVAPVSGPGGGGGGGGYLSASGGNGFAGQVEVVYTSGTAPGINVCRCLLDVPAAGDVDQGVIFQLSTSGTIATLKLLYRTASGGSLELIGLNSGGGTLFDSGTKTFGLNGVPCMVSAYIQQSGTSVNWLIEAIQPGASSLIATFNGTVASCTTNQVTGVQVNVGGKLIGTAIGHLVVQYLYDPLTNVSQAINGYAGELAANRITRLCTENGIASLIKGDPASTGAMGPQTDEPLLNLLQECEDVDRGLIYEARTFFGISYITFSSLQAQVPAIVLDYPSAHLSGALIPAEDDQLTRNQITVTRTNGSSFFVQSSSGDMSIQPPPNGVGPYPYSLTVNCFQDSQLPGIADTILTFGTVCEPRYPSIQVALERSAVQALFLSLTALNVGSYVQITNPPVYLPPTTIKQIIYGFTETINAYQFELDMNGVPESPFEGGDQS
jgi:hypothetical protein